MKRLQVLVMCSLMSAAVSNVGVAMAGAEEPDYVLDPVIITAQRVEKRDLDTPTAVTVKTGEELKETGATTAAEAVQFVEGVATHSQNPYGQSAGRMSSEVVIRGMKKGTLVLLNGVPLNMNSLFQLDNVPVESIEKVEVIRGVSSAMYGSEAAGGVINIITKQNLPKEIKVAFGTEGAKYYSLTSQEDKLGIVALYSEAGRADNTTFTIGRGSTPNTKTDFLGSKKVFLSGTYKFDDRWSLYLSHNQDNIRGQRIVSNAKGSYQVGDLYQTTKDKGHDEIISLAYDGKTVNGSVYAIFKSLDYNTYDVRAASYSSKEHLEQTKYGTNVTKEWNRDKAQFIFGTTVEKESYDRISQISTKRVGKYERNNYSLYGNSSYMPNEKDTFTLGLRFDVTEMEKGKSYKEVLPQFQYNRMLGKDSSWYVNVGRTFRAPTFAELYSNPITERNARYWSNPDLKPETGWVYEVGYKKQIDKGVFKAALFYMDMEDHIDTARTTIGGITKDRQQNFSEYKNKGIEVAWYQTINKRFHYNLGVTLQDPKELDDQNGWGPAYHKYQITAGLGYKDKKWKAHVSANYLGERANKARDYFLVNVNAEYKWTDDISFYGTIHNVFDRENITNESDTYYYGTPRTFMVGMKHSF